MGAFLVRQRQGVRDIRISYGGGSFYNAGPRRFQPAGLSGQIVLHQEDGAIVLGLPTARAAISATVASTSGRGIAAKSPKRVG